MKKPTDKQRMDFVERHPIVMMILSGRKECGKQPCSGANTLREAIDEILLADELRRPIPPKRPRGRR